MSQANTNLHMFYSPTLTNIHSSQNNFVPLAMGSQSFKKDSHVTIYYHFGNSLLAVLSPCE